MIDNCLIDQGVLHASQSLQNNTLTDIPNLYKIDNFLSHDIISKLNSYLNSSTTNWHPAPGIDQYSTYNQNKLRYQINWDPDTVVEEIRTMIESLTTLVNKIYPQDILKFLGINLWKDSAGYKIHSHTDNPIIAAALQIYLTEADNVDLGTSFFYKGATVRIPGVVNSGYLLCNAYPVPHRTTSEIPNGTTRYSLYAIWTKA